MTSTDAAALTLLGMRQRRLLAALVRALTNRSAADDIDQLPQRQPGESLLRWACRCRAPGEAPARLDRAAHDLRAAAEARLRQAAAAGIGIVTLGTDSYPPLLAAISDPPPLLWVRGEIAALSARGVALVGSRAATPHGLSLAKSLAFDLASAGWIIVSGLARGIDSAAHAAALAASGRTIAVLGSGPDRIYPPEHAELARHIGAAGAIVSEFPPGTPPRTYHFPLRNRIISGLVRAVVVVEAPEKSGALITASTALEQGRDVMAVPGAVAGQRNRGAHLLIRDGATVVESAADILAELDSLPGAVPADKTFAGDWSTEEQSHGEFTVDELAASIGQPPRVVLARLLELEMVGRIQRVGGGRFVWTARRVLT